MSYASELEHVTSLLHEVSDGGIVSTENISVFSVMPEGMQGPDDFGARELVRGLLKYHSYQPGEPTDIPIRDGKPYGIGVDIDVGKDFTREDFDQMVEDNWDDVKGYGVNDLVEKINEWEDKSVLEYAREERFRFLKKLHFCTL